MKAAVIGHPVAHSKSPIIHQHWIEQYGLQGSYEAIDIAPESLTNEIKKMIDDGYDGFNVTVPHKRAVMNLCDEIDGNAQLIGAVNTVIIKDKKLIGTNTDSFGFIENIKSSAPDFDFKNKTVFVLGAGGAARAVIYGLVCQGVDRIKLSNRTAEKALELAIMAPDIIAVVPWENKSQAIENIDLLVNTTSLGMDKKPPLEIDLSALPQTAPVNDIVYAPPMTELLKNAKSRGNHIITGIGMLLHQARPAFEAWTGILPEVTQELTLKVLR